jgi:hypothetical protein
MVTVLCDFESFNHRPPTPIIYGQLVEDTDETEPTEVTEISKLPIVCYN